MLQVATLLKISFKDSGGIAISLKCFLGRAVHRNWLPSFSRVLVLPWEYLLQELIFTTASAYSIVIRNNPESNIFNCHNLKGIDNCLGFTLVLGTFLIKNLGMDSKMHLILFCSCSNDIQSTYLINLYSSQSLLF